MVKSSLLVGVGLVGAFFLLNSSSSVSGGGGGSSFPQIFSLGSPTQAQGSNFPLTSTKKETVSNPLLGFESAQNQQQSLIDSFSEQFNRPDLQSHPSNGFTTTKEQQSSGNFIAPNLPVGETKKGSSNIIGVGLNSHNTQNKNIGNFLIKNNPPAFIARNLFNSVRGLF